MTFDSFSALVWVHSSRILFQGEFLFDLKCILRAMIVVHSQSVLLSTGGGEGWGGVGVRLSQHHFANILHVVIRRYNT